MSGRMRMGVLSEFLRDSLIALAPGLAHLLAGWAILG